MDIENYILDRNDNIWKYNSHPFDENPPYEAKKGRCKSELMYKISNFNINEIISNYIIEQRMPLLCCIDLEPIFYPFSPVPVYQAGIIIGCITDTNDNVSHVILYTGVSSNLIVKLSIESLKKDLLQFLRHF